MFLPTRIGNLFAVLVILMTSLKSLSSPLPSLQGESLSIPVKNLQTADQAELRISAVKQYRLSNGQKMTRLWDIELCLLSSPKSMNPRNHLANCKQRAVLASGAFVTYHSEALYSVICQTVLGSQFKGKSVGHVNFKEASLRNQFVYTLTKKSLEREPSLELVYLGPGQSALTVYGVDCIQD